MKLCKLCKLCGGEQVFLRYFPICPVCEDETLAKVTHSYIKQALDQHEAWIKSKHLGILTSIAEHNKRMNVVVEEIPQPV